MVCYQLDVAGWKPALAVVAAHGMTDLNTWDWVGHYAVWMLMPMPSSVVTSIFCASSVVHFADDGGPFTSAFAHLLALATGMRHGADAAFKVMLAYLVLWHTPNHYLRHIKEHRWRGVLTAAMSTCVALLGCRRLPDRLWFNNWLQRIVISHISHEAGIRAGHGCRDVP
jgi:hypothetical protein